ncbi:pyruvate dehydrogenase [acetyl-transferring]-phosphatase 1, mitochondrial [Palaemon carinicauda]|uniref:pyruvate dehydrogenase [acetyl-transferring]-phosphatase 1, mitochondrial n=1 Tax=Palaemon carinicauda TaxID=392227 RepID=UPI0035B6754F
MAKVLPRVYRNVRRSSIIQHSSFIRIPMIQRACFSTRHTAFASKHYPRLSPQEVSQVLRQHETVIKISSGEEVNWAADEGAVTSSFSVASVDSNQLASNSPIEDKLAAARCLHTTGYLFGVFDGHGGPECSQVVAKRLFDYVAASLVPRAELRRIVSEWESGIRVPLTQVFNDPSQFVSGLQEIYEASLLNYCRTLLATDTQDFSMEEALIGAFQQLDDDISREVQEHRNSEMLEPLLRVALSGSVACVAHIDGPHLHIANTGDCGAVMGVQLQEAIGGWRALRLTNDHSWENSAEVNRVLAEHPPSEGETVVKDQRLLGLLMPFRAFGDFRFKWDRDVQVDIIEQYVGPGNIIRNYFTPPYLTCVPEVTYHRLRPFDRFMILGSDGLWESMSAVDCITLVGEYMSGRQTLQPVRFPRQAMTLGEVSLLLDQRQRGLNLKPVDTNAATHLIRYALGGSDTGLDHGRLSHSLTLRPEVRRYFRDDISIHVVFFDANFLRVCSVET